MASIFDLAVVALALMVCGTLGLLAWTLGVTIPTALRRVHRDLLTARVRIVVAERRVRDTAEIEGDR
ncbi:MAG TPA: hypothetical protein VK838_06620 [Candidatus Limnocylindrales bacterium]|nr:hypothetical protein [Candidatus Limnocylindrales bacterium]